MSSHFLLTALLLSVLPPQQGRWTQIGTTTSGNPVYVDQRSVRTTNGIVTATIRTVFVKAVKTPQGDLTSSRTTAMFDCAARKLAVKENIYFHDEKANRVYQRSAPKIPGYSVPIRGAMPDVAMAHFCKAEARP